MSRYLPPIAFSSRDLPKKAERKFYKAVWKRFVIDNPDKGIRRLDLYHVPLDDTEYFTKEAPELWVERVEGLPMSRMHAAKAEAVAKGYLSVDGAGQTYFITEKMYDEFATPFYVKAYRYLQSNPWWISLIALGVSVIALFRSY